MTAGSADSRDEGVRREAADWFARIRGAPTEQDRAELETWLAADPRHAAAYERLTQQWDRTAFLARSNLAGDRNLSRAAAWHRRPGTRRALAASVAVVLAIGALATLTPDRSGEPPAAVAAGTVANPSQAVRSIRLADGSSVRLDAGGAMVIRLTAAVRRIELVRGRARFAVAREARRPFIVDAAGGSVIARGTLFDVAIDGQAVRVALWHGTVEVRSGRMPDSGESRGGQRLLPGQGTTYGPGAAATGPTPLAPAERDWADAMISFDRTPLAEAAAAVSRDSPVTVTVDGRTAALPVSGAFRERDAEGFAEAAAAMFDLRIVRRGSILTLEPRKKP